jgi:hypothetical protein
MTRDEPVATALGGEAGTFLAERFDDGDRSASG